MIPGADARQVRAGRPGTSSTRYSRPTFWGGKPVLSRVLDGPVEQISQHDILICGSARCGWKGEGSLRHGVGRETPRGGRFPGAGAGDRRELLWRLQFARFGQSVPPAGPTGQGALSRRERGGVGRDYSRAHPWRPGGRAAESAGKTIGRKFFELYGDVAFFNRQRPHCLAPQRSTRSREHGRVLPFTEGFQALAKVLEKGDPNVGRGRDHEVEASRPGRRRFSPTGQKWAMAAGAADKTRYIICNADEGDPGGVHGPQHARVRPAQRGRGHDHRRLRHGALLAASSTSAPNTPWPSDAFSMPIDQCRQWGALGQGYSRLGF